MTRPASLRILKLVKPYSGYLALALLGAVAEIGADLLQPWPLKFLFDSVFAGHVQTAPSWIASWLPPLGALYFIMGAVAVIAVLNAAGSYVQDYFMPRVGHWVMHDLRRQLYWHVQSLSMSYHDTRRTGELLNTLTGDIQSVRELIESALLGVAISALTLASMIAIMWAMDWRFALFALSVSPVLAFVVYRLTRRIKDASRDVRKLEGSVISVAQEALSAMRVVQAFTREEHEQARFERQNSLRIEAGINARTLQARLKPIAECLMAAGTILVLWYGARQVLAGHLSPGSLLVFLAYLTRLYRPMRDLAKQSDVISRAAVGMERIFALLDTDLTVRDLPGAREAPVLRGRIQFRDVSFEYAGGQPVLRGIDLDLEPGKTVALVGSTGSGKTTLVSLIPRFHDPATGSVRIDGNDVRDYTILSLRSQISLVLQETILFHGSVRENIAYGRPDITEEEIVASAEAANADEFIRQLPAGYDTIIGERGATLSGGQRQRIAIARAIVRNAPIVLLDEPTTGLDASSEALVMEGLSRLIAGRTALIIAHRLSTIVHCDEILVLEGGRIVERGSPGALLAAGGRYAELSESQFHGHEGSGVEREPAGCA